MPIYVLKCDRCGETFERLFSNFKAIGGVSHCPYCKDGLLYRQPSAPNFSVNGYNAGNGYSK